MMPVCLERLDGSGHRVPITCDPFRIGRGEQNELRIEDTRIAPQHARLRYQRGSWVLSPKRGEYVAVNGQSQPVMALTHGDTIQLSHPGARDDVALVLHDGFKDSFVPPDASWTAAWLNVPGSADPAARPDALGARVPLGTRPIDRAWRVAPSAPGRAVRVVKRLAPLARPQEGDRFLALLTALAGAPHPAVAATADGGIYREPDGRAWTWHAADFVPGTDLKATLSEGGASVREALAWCAALAGGLAHLHARGVVHRDVSPGNVILTPEGRAVLIDLGSAFLAKHGAPSSGGVRGTPGFVAPEEVSGDGRAIGPAADVYGLCAVTYALLVGTPPAAGEDVLETLVDSMRRPSAPSEVGVELSAAFERVLLEGLDSQSAARPSAEDLAAAAQAALAEQGP